MDVDFGDIVYLKTDPEQLERQVSGILKRPGATLYELCCGTESSVHYSFEISVEIDVLKQVKSNN